MTKENKFSQQLGIYLTLFEVNLQSQPIQIPEAHGLKSQGFLLSFTDRAKNILQNGKGIDPKRYYTKKLSANLAPIQGSYFAGSNWQVINAKGRELEVAVKILKER